jgi:hypothetical protein
LESTWLSSTWLSSAQAGKPHWGIRIGSSFSSAGGEAGDRPCWSAVNNTLDSTVNKAVHNALDGAVNKAIDHAVNASLNSTGHTPGNQTGSAYALAWSTAQYADVTSASKVGAPW